MNVVVVEDSPLIAKILCLVIEREGGHVVGRAGNAESALSLIRACLPDVVTLDLTLPGGGSLELLKEIATNLAIPVIVVSGATYEGSPAIAEALRLGAEACIDKASIVHSRALIDTLKAASVARV